VCDMHCYVDIGSHSVRSTRVMIVIALVVSLLIVSVAMLVVVSVMPIVVARSCVVVREVCSNTRAHTLRHHCDTPMNTCSNYHYSHTNTYTTLHTYIHIYIYICITYTLYTHTVHTQQDGFIDGNDVKQVLGASAVAPLTAVKGRQGRITFAPPPGSDELFNSETSNSETAKKKRKGGSSSDSAVVDWITDFCAHFLLGAIAGGIGASAVYPIGKLVNHTIL
jgi:hypothetical protein